MRKATYAFFMPVMLVAVLFLASCNAIEDDSESATMIVVENLLGSNMSGEAVNFLQSDVLYVDPSTQESSIIADTAVATLRARLLDPGSLYGPSQYNDITLDRYVVSYTRSDGQNSEGVDVPYAFEGYLNLSLTVDTAVDVSFIIVREVAKMEPPLVNLQNNRDLGVLQVHAKVQFYGHDLTGNVVTASGYLDIFFANYANGSEDEE
jgi:hypothetical protein